jgi:dihydrofolate reductase
MKNNNLKAILAVNNLGFIGLKNGLPWACKEDFKHFKSMTMGGKLIVGWRTFQTLPPLKGREIIVHNLRNDDNFYDFDWCIGGKATYEYFADKFTELHISHIDDNTIGDTLFPDFSKLNPECKIFNYYFTSDNKTL